MAPRPHDLVLRDVRAEAARARPPAVRPGLRVPLQLVLRGRRAAARQGAPRGALPPIARRGAGLSPPRRPGDRPRLLETGTVAPAIASTITLGLHHEQQHQELLLTDIKHAFGSHPLQPSYHAATPAPARRPRRRRSGFDRSTAASSGSATRDQGSRSTTRGPATAVSSTPSRSPTPGHLRRVPGLHARRRLRAAGALALRRVADGRERAVAGAALLAGRPRR